MAGFVYINGMTNNDDDDGFETLWMWGPTGSTTTSPSSLSPSPSSLTSKFVCLCVVCVSLCDWMCVSQFQRVFLSEKERERKQKEKGRVLCFSAYFSRAKVNNRTFIENNKTISQQLRARA